MQQIEPERSEKIESEYRDKPKFIETFGTFGPSGFCCKEEKWHLSNLIVSTKMIFFSIETLIEKIKPVLTEKHFFEERRDSKLKIISAFPDIKIVMHESKKTLNRMPHYNYRAFDQHVDGRSQTGSYAGYQVWKLKSSSISDLGAWYTQDSDAREKTGYFLIDWFVTTS